MVYLFHKGNIIEVQKFDSQPSFYFKEKIQFIINNIDVNNVDSLSNIHCNKIFYGCRYDMDKEQLLFKLGSYNIDKNNKCKDLYLGKTKITEFNFIKNINKTIKYEYFSDYYRNSIINIIKSISSYQNKSLFKLSDYDIYNTLIQYKQNIKTLFPLKSDIPPKLEYLRTLKPSSYSKIKISYLHRFEHHNDIFEVLSVIMKNGGKLILNDFDIKSLKDQNLINLKYNFQNDWNYYWFRSFENWKEIASNHGFKVVDINKSDLNISITFILDKKQTNFLYAQPHLYQTIPFNKFYRIWDKSLLFLNDEYCDKINLKSTFMVDRTRGRLLEDILFIIMNPKIQNIIYHSKPSYFDKIQKLFPNLTFNKNSRQYTGFISDESFDKQKTIINDYEFYSLKYNPSENKITFKGDIVKTLYNSYHSNEVRIWSESDKQVEYKIQNRLNYHNFYIRSSHYNYPHYNIDNCFDCTAEGFIIIEYLNYMKYDKSKFNDIKKLL